MADEIKVRGSGEYTEAMLFFLREGIKIMDRTILTAEFNRVFGQDKTVSAIVGTCKRHGFFTGRTGHFEKGQEPWNAGTKGVMRRNSGSFRKGSVPPNRRPMFSERTSKDGYIEIKVAERNPYTGSKTRYKHKHVWLWEQANGPVPEGHCIRFRDGNNRNFDPTNLICVSRGVNAVLNKRGYLRHPKPLRESVLAVALIEDKIRERRRA